MENQEQEKVVKRRGRPKGSKNKKTLAKEALTEQIVSDGIVDGNYVAPLPSSFITAPPAPVVKQAVKGRRGRPPKNAASAVSLAAVQSETVSSKKSITKPVAAKSDAPIVAAGAPAAVSADGTIKKRRGRPPKNRPVIEPLTVQQSVESPVQQQIVEQPQEDARKRRRRPTTTYVNSLVGMVNINEIGGEVIQRTELNGIPERQERITSEEEFSLENVVTMHESKEISGVRVEGVFEFAVKPS